MINEQTPTDTHESDEVEDNFTTIQSIQQDQEFRMSDAARKAQQLNDTWLENTRDETSASTKPRRKFPVVGLTTGLVLSGIAAVGITGIASEAGGTNNPNQGVADPSIESVTLNPGANLRLDPWVGTGDQPTGVLQLDARVTIDANHDIRVLDDDKTGEWIGIPLADIKVSIPDINSEGDKDGILWVSEQGVDNVKHAIETSNNQ
jgi:hypothetical protein